MYSDEDGYCTQPPYVCGATTAVMTSSRLLLLLLSPLFSSQPNCPAAAAHVSMRSESLTCVCIPPPFPCVWGGRGWSEYLANMVPMVPMIGSLQRSARLEDEQGAAAAAGGGGGRWHHSRVAVTLLHVFSPCRGGCIYITVSNLHVGWFVRGDGTTSWGQDTVSLNMVLRYIRALPLLLYIPPVRVLAVTPSLPPSPTRL